eukprot:6684110-Prymnesium_polylepis.1
MECEVEKEQEQEQELELSTMTVYSRDEALDTRWRWADLDAYPHKMFYPAGELQLVGVGGQMVAAPALRG